MPDKGKIERRVRDQRLALDPRTQTWSDLEHLQRWTDAELSARAEQLICPATGLSVAESWAAERITLTPLPEILPEPFDDVGVRRVGIDGLIAFEGRQYSVPFPSAAIPSATPSEPWAASPILANGSRFVAAPAPSKF